MAVNTCAADLIRLLKPRGGKKKKKKTLNKGCTCSISCLSHRQGMSTCTTVYTHIHTHTHTHTHTHPHTHTGAPVCPCHNVFVSGSCYILVQWQHQLAAWETSEIMFAVPPARGAESRSRPQARGVDTVRQLGAGGICTGICCLTGKRLAVVEQRGVTDRWPMGVTAVRTHCVCVLLYSVLKRTRLSFRPHKGQLHCKVTFIYHFYHIVFWEQFFTLTCELEFGWVSKKKGCLKKCS